MEFSILNYTIGINFEVQLYLILTALLGAYLRLIFIHLQKQYFLKTNDKLFVFSILPVTGYIITSVISNDIALSLGMVGALSIVRFRTPIKNPTELVIYFLLITLGIVMNVSVNLALNLVLFITILFIILECYNQLKTNFFKIDPGINNDSSFSLLISTKSQLEKDYESYNLSLSHFSRKDDSTYSYMFSLKEKSDGFGYIESLDKDIVISFSVE
jgi:hypothetical protein